MWWTSWGRISFCFYVFINLKRIIITKKNYYVPIIQYIITLVRAGMQAKNSWNKLLASKWTVIQKCVFFPRSLSQPGVGLPKSPGVRWQKSLGTRSKEYQWKDRSRLTKSIIAGSEWIVEAKLGRLQAPVRCHYPNAYTALPFLPSSNFLTWKSNRWRHDISNTQIG